MLEMRKSCSLELQYSPQGLSTALRSFQQKHAHKGQAWSSLLQCLSSSCLSCLVKGVASFCMEGAIQDPWAPSLTPPPPLPPTAPGSPLRVQIITHLAFQVQEQHQRVFPRTAAQMGCDTALLIGALHVSGVQPEGAAGVHGPADKCSPSRQRLSRRG